MDCNKRGESLRARHIMSDFVIGAHVEVLADTLITRDRGIYKFYFKDLKLNLGD